MNDPTECPVLCDFNEERHCTVGLWERLETFKGEGKLPDNCPWWKEYRGMESCGETSQAGGKT